jgi:hypothetical protein
MNAGRDKSGQYYRGSYTTETEAKKKAIDCGGVVVPYRDRTTTKMRWAVKTARLDGRG